MPRAAKDPTAVQYALDKRAAGWSYEQIAADMTATGFPVTGMTVMRWCKVAPPARCEHPSRQPHGRHEVYLDPKGDGGSVCRACGATWPAQVASPHPAPKKKRTPPSECTCKRVRGQAHYPSCATHALAAARAAAPKPIDALKATLAARKAEAEAAPAEPEISDAPTTAETLDVMRAQLTYLLREVRANRVSNPPLAQKLGRDAAAYAAIVARLEKGATDDADVVRIRREDIEETMVGLRARVAATVARPLHCAECSRELSIKWGLGGAGL